MFKGTIKLSITNPCGNIRHHVFNNIVTNKGLLFIARSGIKNTISVGSGRADIEPNVPSLSNKIKEQAGTWENTRAPNVNVETNLVTRTDRLVVVFPAEVANTLYTEIGIAIGDDLLTYAHTVNTVGEVAGITVLKDEILSVEYTIESSIPYLNDISTANQDIIFRNTGALGDVPNNISNNNTLMYVRCLSAFKENDIKLGLPPKDFNTTIPVSMSKNDNKITIAIPLSTSIPNGSKIFGFYVTGHYEFIIPLVNGVEIKNSTEYVVTFNLEFKGGN